MITVATIIVTYNRKNSLLKCIEAVCLQSRQPDIIYIIDNNSNDGTDKLLKSKGLINSSQKYKNINLKYVRLQESTRKLADEIAALNEKYKKMLDAMN